jgi:hypothetical protein
LAGRVLAFPLVHVMAVEYCVEMQLDALVPVWLQVAELHVATVPLHAEVVWQLAKVL